MLLPPHTANDLQRHARPHGLERLESRAKSPFDDIPACEAARHDEYLTAFSASGLDLMSYVDTSATYRYVNATYLSYWGRRSDEVIGRKVVDLMGESVYEATIQPHLEQALAGHQVHCEARIVFPARGPRHMEVTYLPAFGARGEVVGVVVRVHDIDALHQREQELHETIARLEQKSLEQQRFIHIISHDLREPINMVNNFSQLLLEELAPTLNPEARRHLRFVHSGGQRMKGTLEELLRYVQLDRHALVPQPVDFNLLMEQVRADEAPTLQRQSGELRSGPLPCVMGDTSLLGIALLHLVDNGLKFNRPGVPPQVEVAARQEHGRQVISVIDNGIGIPAEQQQHIFEMFNRLNTRREYEGIGLGLAICRRIMGLHDGQVRVSSTPGQGSRFELVFATQADPFLQASLI
jgi:PAS domain S-box-containing protein